MGGDPCVPRAVGSWPVGPRGYPTSAGRGPVTPAPGTGRPAPGTVPGAGGPRCRRPDRPTAA